MSRLAAIAAALCLGGPATAAAPITMFAAASMTDALQAIGQAYAEAGGGPVRFSFASSSTLARQIEAGAPVQIFCSADERWMDYLADRDLIEATSRVSPIGNALVLVAPKAARAAPVAIDSSLDLGALLGPEGRLAVGDPAHVPAGIYAKQALTSLGLWREAEPRLAPADNVRAALALVARGEAPYGIVYGTDAAISDGIAVVGTFPDRAHRPITYPCAILKGQADRRVARFYGFLTGPEGLAIFGRFGFRTE